MKHISVWMALLNLVFLGCTKTILIREPVTYYEEVPVPESRPTYEIRTNEVRTSAIRTNEVRMSSNEVPYVAEPIPVLESKPFNIKPLEVFDKMQEPHILILDVRMPNEIPQDGKIANSMMIPVQVLAQNLNRLDKSKTIIVYCHSGSRSVEATKLLRSHGFDAINMLGGIQAWKKEHLSVRWK